MLKWACSTLQDSVIVQVDSLKRTVLSSGSEDEIIPKAQRVRDMKATVEEALEVTVQSD